MRGFSPGRINVRNPAESIAIFRKDDKWLNSVNKYTWIFENRVSEDKGYLAIKRNKIRPKPISDAEQ